MSIDFAPRMRREPSRTERILWTHLRNRQLAGAKFRRQAPIGDFIVDFLCFERSLIVEIDGGVHGFPGRAEKNAVRQQWLEAHGYTVVRFSDCDVVDDVGIVLERLRRVLTPPAPPA